MNNANYNQEIAAPHKPGTAVSVVSNLKTANRHTNTLHSPQRDVPKHHPNTDEAFCSPPPPPSHLRPSTAAGVEPGIAFAARMVPAVQRQQQIARASLNITSSVDDSTVEKKWSIPTPASRPGAVAVLGGSGTTGTSSMDDSRATELQSVVAQPFGRDTLLGGRYDPQVCRKNRGEMETMIDRQELENALRHDKTQLPSDCSLVSCEPISSDDGFIFVPVRPTLAPQHFGMRVERNFEPHGHIGGDLLSSPGAVPQPVMAAARPPADVDATATSAPLPDPKNLRVDLQPPLSSSSSRSRSQTRGKWMLVCCSLSLIVMVVVGVSLLIVLVFIPKPSPDTPPPDTPPPDTPPPDTPPPDTPPPDTPPPDTPPPDTPPPDTPPPDTRRKSTPNGVQEYVVARNISSPDDFALPNTPQSMAARWLAMEDERNEPTPVFGDDGQNEDAYEFVLRYIMAVLYYATKGYSWTNINFMSPASVCSWNAQLRLHVTFDFGLFCDEDQKAKQILLNLLGLDGELPKELFKLDTLEILELRLNSKLRGSFPTELCSMTNLHGLAIGFTGISGEIPGCINNLVHLQALILSDLGLTGQIPNMHNLVNMRILCLDDNNLVGNIKNHFASMPALQYLILDNNSFTADIDESWLSRQNRFLHWVDLSNNNIRGPFPVKLLELEDIAVIDLSRNQLTGSISKFPVSTIQFLALHENNLTGEIHFSISNLQSRLFHLDLSSNGFTGDMPTKIGELVELTYLFLANNPFTPGPIPDSFQDLFRLNEFSVQKTFRTGRLPEFISTWTSLVLLDLASNEFVGNIPSPYGDLVQLEFLLLNSNRLSGVVPESIADLVKLRAAFLEDNQLTGDLSHVCANGAFTEPTGDFDGDEILVADCIEGAGTITCGCCVCCHPNSMGIEDNQCNDHELIANSNPMWETAYKRAKFIFGNDIQFIHSDHLG